MLNENMTPDQCFLKKNEYGSIRSNTEQMMKQMYRGCSKKGLSAGLIKLGLRLGLGLGLQCPRGGKG